MNTAERRIGRVGTISRVIVGLGLVYLALTHGGLSWRLTWHDAVLGLIVLPAVMIAIGLTARRFAGRAVHFTGPVGLAVNCAVIVALLANRYTAGGAELFYGITLLVAAWCGQPGCEHERCPAPHAAAQSGDRDPGRHGQQHEEQRAPIRLPALEHGASSLSSP